MTDTGLSDEGRSRGRERVPGKWKSEVLPRFWWKESRNRGMTWETKVD